MHDKRIHRLAGRQHWLVTRGQLAALGLSRRQIEVLLASGVLFKVHRGVYGFAGAPNTYQFRVMAGVLAAGDDAWASHRSAAVLFGLRRVTGDAVQVTVPGRRAPRIAAVETHRTEVFRPGDRAKIDKIPVTAPARILADLAGELDPFILEGALDDVLVRKLATLSAIERQVKASRLPGAPLLRELVAERRNGKRPTESVLEDDLGALIKRYGLPEPERQYEIEDGDIRFDCAYPDRRLDFEADGDEHHAGLLDQRRDAVRDARARALGWTVRRFSTEDIRKRPDAVAATVARLLGLERPA